MRLAMWSERKAVRLFRYFLIALAVSAIALFLCWLIWIIGGFLWGEFGR